MSNDQETSIVIDTLTKDMGFEAQRIPEQPHLGQRADIWARKGEDYFLFEVKSREDHPSLMAYFQNAQAYEEAEYCEELKRRNVISSILERASRQLAETSKPNGEFSCVWFRIVEELIPDGGEFIQTSLYGIKYLWISDSESNGRGAKCYYFDYNDFYNYRNINAVILDNGRGKIHFCVNDYSDAINQFRNSELYKYFKKTERIIDPITFDVDSGDLVADIDCPRGEVDKVKEYVETKYKIKINTTVEMKCIGGMVKLPQYGIDMDRRKEHPATCQPRHWAIWGKGGNNE